MDNEDLIGMPRSQLEHGLKEYENRIQNIMDYLETTERESFTHYDVYKIIHHIRKGEGWL